MAETCRFCGLDIEEDQPLFVSEDAEHCHQKCLERRLVGLEFKGVKPELIEAILQSFNPPPKKRRSWFFARRESK